MRDQEVIVPQASSCDRAQLSLEKPSSHTEQTTCMETIDG